MKKLTKHKFIFFYILPIFLLASLFFIFPHSANAQEGGGFWNGVINGIVGDILITPLCWVIYTIVKFLALLLIVVVQILIAVSSYNCFISAPAVTEGWAIIRDVANMFFVIVLLIIAISTILGIETYNYKKLLPKLLLMAILINFSKMICGLLIDVSQVVMMTFVDGYKEAAAGNMATAFGLDNLLKFRWNDVNSSGDMKGETKVGNMEIMGALLLALVLVIVAISVTLGTILIFVIRIIMIWFLVVLSPLAYLLSAFPGGEKYAQQWWTEFTKYLIVGPVMAFFLWLSLMVMSSADKSKDLSCFPFNPTKEQTTVLGGTAELVGKATAGTLYSTISGVGSSSFLLSYIIAIGMLCGSMMVAQQLGVAGAGMALNLAKKTGKGILKTSWAPAKRLGEKMYAGELYKGFGKGVLLNPMELYKRYKTGRETVKEERMQKGDAFAGINMGAGGVKGALLGMGAQGYYDNYVGFKGLRKMVGTGWSTKRELEYTEGEIKGVEGDMANQITKGPSKEAVLQHMEDFKKTNPGATSNEEKKEKKKFINDWKVGEVRKINAGPSEEEITNNLTNQNLPDTKENRKKVTEKWKLDQMTDLGIGDKNKFNNSMEAFKGWNNRKKDIQELAPDMAKDRIKERSVVSKLKEERKDLNIPQLEGAFESALVGKDTMKVKAIMSLLAEKGGLNDLIKHSGKKDSTEGYKEFMKEKTKELGMDKQEALGFQRDIGDIAEHEGQTRFGKTIDVDKNGEFRERTSDEIDEVRYDKIGKAKGAREIFQHVPDHIVEDGKITNPGQLLIKENFEAIEELLRQGRLNPDLIKQFSSNDGEKSLRKLWKNEDQSNVNKLINKLKSSKGSFADRIKGISSAQITPRQQKRQQQAQQQEEYKKRENRKKAHAQEIYDERIKTGVAGDNISDWTDAEQRTQNEDNVLNEINNRIVPNINTIGAAKVNLVDLDNIINKIGGTLGTELLNSLKELTKIKNDNISSKGQSLTREERKTVDDNYSRLMIELLRKIERDLRENEDDSGTV